MNVQVREIPSGQALCVAASDHVAEIRGIVLACAETRRAKHRQSGHLGALLIRAIPRPFDLGNKDPAGTEEEVKSLVENRDLGRPYDGHCLEGVIDIIPIGESDGLRGSDQIPRRPRHYAEAARP